MIVNYSKVLLQIHNDTFTSIHYMQILINERNKWPDYLTYGLILSDVMKLEEETAEKENVLESVFKVNFKFLKLYVK